MTSTGAVTKSFNARVYNINDIGNSNPTPVASATFTASFSSASTKWFSIDFGSGTNLTTTPVYVFAVEEAVEDTATNISWREPANSSGYLSDFSAQIDTTTIYERLDGTNGYTALTPGSTNFGFQLSTEAVPEPSSLVLMGMGLASVAAAAKRARRKKAIESKAAADSVVV
jgi:hypothetical protein